MRHTPPSPGKILRLGYDTPAGKILDEVTRWVASEGRPEYDCCG